MGIIDNIVTVSTYMYITTTPIPLLAVNFPQNLKQLYIINYIVKVRKDNVPCKVKDIL